LPCSHGRQLLWPVSHWQPQRRQPSGMNQQPVRTWSSKLPDDGAGWKSRIECPGGLAFIDFASATLTSAIVSSPRSAMVRGKHSPEKLKVPRMH
jgi:hypothetical protein